MLLAGAAPGQQEDLPEVFSEVIDVRVVNIEIVASITVHDPLTGTNLTSTGEIGPN